MYPRRPPGSPGSPGILLWKPWKPRNPPLGSLPEPPEAPAGSLPEPPEAPREARRRPETLLDHQQLDDACGYLPVSSACSCGLPGPREDYPAQTWLPGPREDLPCPESLLGSREDLPCPESLLEPREDLPCPEWSLLPTRRHSDHRMTRTTPSAKSTSWSAAPVYPGWCTQVVCTQAGLPCPTTSPGYTVFPPSSTTAPAVADSVSRCGRGTAWAQRSP